MQFAGQTHVLTVPIARTDVTREELAATFERAYFERFGVELREMQALVMSLRTAVIGRRRPVSLAGLGAASRGRPPRRYADVWFDRGWRTRRSTGASTCPPARPSPARRSSSSSTPPR